MIDMMTNSLFAHNGGFICSIKGGTYLGGGKLGTRRREHNPYILGPCDMYLED